MSKRLFQWKLLAAVALLPWLLAVDGSDYWDNQARLSKISPEQMDQLLRKKATFDLLSPPEQERLRRLDREIHAQANAAQLMQTLRGYHEWISTLRSSEQARIKDLPPEKRIAEITNLISQHRQRDIGVTNETRLPPEDFEALTNWVRELGERKKDEIAKLVAPLERTAMSGSRRQFAAPMARLIGAIVRGMVSEDKLDELVSEEDLAELSKMLTANAAEILHDQPTKRDKIRLVVRWVNALVMPRASDAELMRYFSEALKESDREEIIRLGPIEGRLRLLQLYYRDVRFRRSPGRPLEGQPDTPPSEPQTDVRAPSLNPSAPAGGQRSPRN